jgi:microcystin-dependent protein
VSDPYVGEIQAFPFAFAASGFGNNTWLPCFGQLLPVQQYSALFSLIGTYYGGNGTTTFAVPNLSGAVAIGQGQGPGLSNRIVGEAIGAPTVSLAAAEMAQHTHGLQLGIKTAEKATPGPSTEANLAEIDPGFNGFGPLPADTTLAPNAITPTGQGLPHDNIQPNQVLIWCIAVNGIFPSFS